MRRPPNAAALPSLCPAQLQVVDTCLPARLRRCSVPGECSQAVADAIARCLAEVPAERPTAEEMIAILSEKGDS